MLRYKSQTAAALLLLIASIANIAQARPKVAILAFEDISSDDQKKNYGVSSGRKIAEQMVVQFVNNGHFDVIEREQLERTLKEQNFSTSGLVDATQAAAAGKISGVDFIITGTIDINVESKSSGTAIIIRVQKNTVTMTVKLSAKLVNVNTASIVAAESAEGTAFASSTSTDFNSSEIGKTASGLFDQAGTQAARKVTDRFIPRAVELFKPVMPKILVAAVDGQTLYLNAGLNAGLKQGMAVIVYREGEPIIDPATGKVIKIRKSQIGEAIITSAEATSSEATLNQPAQIQAKDVVEPVAVPAGAGGPAPAPAKP